MTQLDIEQLKALIIERSTSDHRLENLEACLLAWSALMTGRHPAELLKLSVRLVHKGERLADQPAGLIRRQNQWGWWLPAAAPRDQKHLRADMCPTATMLYLPATKIVARLVIQCVAARRMKSSGREHPSGTAQPLFVTGEALLERLTALLASRHTIGSERARRATTTPEALARWLPAELIGSAGGDVVPASIITGRVPTVARTAVHYGAVAHRTLVHQYRAAIAAIDAPAHYDIPGEALVTHLGDRRTPTDDAVMRLIQSLADDLEDPNRDVAERHSAMMRYTVGLLCFALAHRGNAGTIPALKRVHAETRFVWINDKVVAGRRSRRLTWISDVALDQLRLYDAHLDQLQSAVSPTAAAAIEQLRAGRELPLFDLRSGRLEPWSVSKAAGNAFGRIGLPKNAGRHWVRAKLVGRCSSETLHAFYGHGPVEDGSWDSTSALDPTAYRADLARALEPLMAAFGWEPRGPKTATP